MKKESDLIYKFMVWTYKIQDIFSDPGEKLLEFGIQEGNVVVDYGCGPGRYLKKSSELTGKSGKVYAIDINKVAIENVKKNISKQGLKNVVPILLKNGNEITDEKFADVVYAIDMFHQIDDPIEFFSEVYKIMKQDGIFYLEDGHQPRELTLKKINQSKMWKIEEEKQKFVKLKALEIQ